MILGDLLWKRNGFQLPIALFLAIMFLASAESHAQSTTKEKPHEFKIVEVTDTIVTFDPETLEETVEIVKSEMRIYKELDVMPVYSLEGCEDVEDEEARELCGQKNLLNAIYGTIHYPKGAKRGGMIVLRFLVDKEGRMMNPEILRSCDAALSQAVLKMFSILQKHDHRWIPGRENGEAAATYFTLPVKFKLED